MGADRTIQDRVSGAPPPRVVGEIATSLPLGRLSPAERRVFDLALDGRSSQAIADDLVLSEATIRSHLTRIYAKLEVRGRMDLLARVATSEGTATAEIDLREPAATSSYGAAPWIATILAVIGIAAGFAVPVSAIVFGPVLLILGLILSRWLPDERRWARFPLLAAGAILCGEALMIGLLFRPG